MKNLLFTIVLLPFGFLIGWSSKSSGKSPQLSETAEELAKLYPVELSQRALKDMRVLSLLHSNDVVMAKEVLIQDLEMQLSVFSHLREKIRQSEFDTQLLRDSEELLNDAKTFLKLSK